MEYMGGSPAVLARARADFESGQFRWVVEALNHVVFAEPGNRAARELAADAMEQLGYQAESATWRNSYLLAARELRGASAAGAPRGVSISPDVVAVLPLQSFLEYLGIRLNGIKAQTISARFDWRLLDGDIVDAQKLTLSNGALNHLPGSHAERPMPLSRPRGLSSRSFLRGARLCWSRSIQVGFASQETKRLFRRFLDALDEFDPMFNVVEP